jgi:hypothetical protein
MLDRAVERVSGETKGKVTAIQGYIRELQFERGQFDTICAAAILHPLRDEERRRSVFTKFHIWLNRAGLDVFSVEDKDRPHGTQVAHKREAKEHDLPFVQQGRAGGGALLCRHFSG